MLNRSFENFLESRYYNELYKAVDGYINRNRSDIPVMSHTITDPNYKKLGDFSIRKVMSRKIQDEFIVSNLQVIANLEIKGYTKYGYESDSSNIWLRIKWNNRGKKSTVWRCISRVEKKKSGIDCPARTIREEDLHAAVVTAINDAWARRDKVIPALKENLRAFFL